MKLKISRELDITLEKQFDGAIAVVATNEDVSAEILYIEEDGSILLCRSLYRELGFQLEKNGTIKVV